MSWKQKLQSTREAATRAGNTASEKAGAAMEQHWPLVRQLWCEKIDPTVRSTITDDDKLRHTLRALHNYLPLPIRLAIREEFFIRTCLNNRDRWMPKEERPEDPPGEEKSD